MHSKKVAISIEMYLNFLNRGRHQGFLLLIGRKLKSSLHSKVQPKKGLQKQSKATSNLIILGGEDKVDLSTQSQGTSLSICPKAKVIREHKGNICVIEPKKTQETSSNW
ncbi:unnamed protein product [Ilex paraguariensis]|uniref:Uncharacterized protein n=1 Tax=Ilex paraguariensis TaxID=185542 RepID=A0ABC8RBQ1_9AQUA